MKVLFSIFFTLFIVTNVFGNEGKTLYVKAGCNKCHGIDNRYDPKKNKVKTLNNLKGWVSNCATHFDVKWFPDEEENVVKYLNETHYKLKQ